MSVHLLAELNTNLGEQTSSHRSGARKDINWKVVSGTEQWSQKPSEEIGTAIPRRQLDKWHEACRRGEVMFWVPAVVGGGGRGAQNK